MTSTDLADERLWLERSDPSQPMVRAELQTTRGHEAAQQGSKEDAAKYYQQALDAYASMQETSSTLNNSALIYLARYGLLGDSADLQSGLDRFEKAVSMAPDNAILLANISNALLKAAVRGVAGAHVQDAEAAAFSDVDALTFLITDGESYQQVHQQLREHEGFREASSYMEKTMVLAPCGTTAYYQALSVYAFLEDEVKLQQIVDAIHRGSVRPERGTRIVGEILLL